MASAHLPLRHSSIRRLATAGALASALLVATDVSAWREAWQTAPEPRLHFRPDDPLGWMSTCSSMPVASRRRS